MSDWKLPWTAACLCGQVKMRVTAAPMVAMACHCRACQKLTSGAYSLTLLLPKEGLELVEGELMIGGLHRAEIQHSFCPHCKNWLFSQAQGMPFINFRPTMLEDSSWVQPYVDTCVEDKLPGVVSGATHSYVGYPPPADYATLQEGFAREGAKPK